MPPLAEVPASANLADVGGRRADVQPQAVMLRRKDDAGVWRDVTAAQFRDEVRALARGLPAAGVAPGDRVALMSHTRYEWTLLDYALWSVGAVVVPIYETSSADQAEWILSDSAARAVIVETETFEQMVAAARARLPALERLWRMQEDLDKLIAASSDVSDETVDSRAKAAPPADVATIIYSSGTTGRPKGCELTHENLLSVVRNAFMGPLAGIHAVVESSTMLFLPLAHVFARVIEIGCLEAGIVLGHCEDMGNLLPELASFQPTFVLAVPRVFEKVYNGAESKAVADGRGKIFARAAATAVAYSEALDSAGGPALRPRGGEALAPRLGHFFRGVGVAVLEGYGLTETSAPVSVNRPDRQKIGTGGLPLPGVAVKIADDGEVLVRGKTVFPGYWRNDEATKAAFTADGWYATGDLGELDDEGFLSITGRKKEIIVTAGGKNVSPAGLEDRLRMHALVSQAMVVGDGRPFIGVLVTIDPERLGPWTASHGKPA